MASVNALIDRLLESPPATVAEAGEHLLEGLSASQLRRDEFLNDPLRLVRLQEAPERRWTLSFAGACDAMV